MAPRRSPRITSAKKGNLVGRKRKQNQVEGAEDLNPASSKRTPDEHLKDLYEKMLKSRAESKKDEEEWKYFLHQMYYTRDPDT